MRILYITIQYRYVTAFSARLRGIPILAENIGQRVNS